MLRRLIKRFIPCINQRKIFKRKKNIDLTEAPPKTDELDLQALSKDRDILTRQLKESNNELYSVRSDLATANNLLAAELKLRSNLEEKEEALKRNIEQINEDNKMDKIAQLDEFMLFNNKMKGMLKIVECEFNSELLQMRQNLEMKHNELTAALSLKVTKLEQLCFQTDPIKAQTCRHLQELCKNRDILGRQLKESNNELCSVRSDLATANNLLAAELKLQMNLKEEKEALERKIDEMIEVNAMDKIAHCDDFLTFMSEMEGMINIAECEFNSKLLESRKNLELKQNELTALALKLEASNEELYSVRGNLTTANNLLAAEEKMRINLEEKLKAITCKGGEYN